MKDAETTYKIKRLEKLVEDQFNEIQMLKQMCYQYDGMVTKNVVGGRVDCEVNVGKKDDKNVSFEDFDINLGGYNGFHDVDVVQNVIKGDDVGLTKVDVEVNKVHREESSREIIDESNDVNCVSGSQKDTFSNVISSIVNNVLTRTNRVKKRKPDMFVTPPSSTPRRKTKAIVECKEYTVLSDEADTNIDDENISADKDELKLKNFRGREDFYGCEEVTKKERNVIMNYLTGERLRMDKKVNHVFCRQQGADLSCGIYTCLWAECYARDDDEAWNYEKICTINSVRACIAATILSDDNGLFGKDK